MLFEIAAIFTVVPLVGDLFASGLGKGKDRKGNYFDIWVSKEFEIDGLKFTKAFHLFYTKPKS